VLNWILETRTDKYSEMCWIKRYREKLGSSNVLNIEDGSIVEDLPSRTITLWKDNQTTTQKAIVALKTKYSIRNLNRLNEMLYFYIKDNQ
jgi:hypothetical protein